MLAQRIRQLRKSKKMTQEDLAKRANTTKGTISNYENGHSSPPNEMLVLLAEILGTTTDYLLGRTDNPHNTSTTNPNTLPTLTPKDERDIARDLEKMLSDLESDEALAFHGEPMDEQSKELLRISLENSMRLAKQLAKQKFTPKKYKK
ncbi:helix-turn-helix domain-containing protein [Aneurinibacillus terranovensis]|uniref:helix-turn-helix domain-containing protein n=1 Tax=Aneurinibacillus terranovensis TaxID=278991 RepID=UPI0003F83524|nr:helix-turn-helix domain-containing protein [Aneurinibacillus terranovensis]